MSNVYVVSYRPLAGTPQGRRAVQRYGLAPYIDASCRREPDLEAKWPTISALCRGRNFAPRRSIGMARSRRLATRKTRRISGSHCFGALPREIDPRSLTLMAARPDRPVPVAESRRVAGGDRLVSDAPSAAQSKDARLIYEVKKGDTLSSIARVFRTTVASLRLWNHLPSTHVSAGDRLMIFTKTGSRPQSH